MIIIVCILLAIVAFGCVCRLIMYRKQMREFTKQLKFHNSIDSNVDFYTVINTKDTLQLRNELEKYKENMKKQEIASKKSEEIMKQLISDVSHDIRTPLTSISGYFQILKDCTDEEEKRYYEKIIDERLKVMNELLETFFDYSKVVQSKEIIKCDMCDIKQILCENLLLFYEDFKRAGIEPQLSIPDTNAYVLGDEGVFTRIFMNLIKNSLVHGKDEIRVEMRVDELLHIKFENKTFEKIPENIEDVFQRFYKGDTARTNGKSSGLGLCIAKELTEKSNGTIKAYSRDGEWFGIVLTFEYSNKE